MNVDMISTPRKVQVSSKECYLSLHTLTASLISDGKVGSQKLSAECSVLTFVRFKISLKRHLFDLEGS